MQKLIEQTISFSQTKKSEKKSSEATKGKSKNTASSVDKEVLNQFINLFYSESQKVDFNDYSVETLYDVSKSAFDFFEVKKPGEIKVRVYNPDEFESEYTLIDIVSDDAPFLVDSTVACLDKHSEVIRNIMHPTYKVVRNESGKLEKFSDKKRDQGRNRNSTSP